MANVTLESEPIQKTVTIEVLRVPVFGNEDRGTRVKPIISHGCNRDRGRINKSSVDLFANAYACVYLISERRLPRSEVPTTRQYSTFSRDTIVLLHTHHNSFIVLRVETE